MKLVIFDWGSTLYDSDNHVLFADTKPTLEYLKGRGHILAIVSLATAGQVKIEERLTVIKQENLGPFFHSIKFAVTDKDSMYVATLKEMGVRPVDTTIVDDRVVRGIAWGIAHGCSTIWVQRGKFSNELPDLETGYPEHTVHSLSEIQGIL